MKECIKNKITFVVNCKGKKIFYNLNMENFTDNKRFWTTVKLFFYRIREICRRKLILKKGMKLCHVIVKWQKF